jgi:hypothetical protein
MHVQATLNADQRQIVGDSEAPDIEKSVAVGTQTNQVFVCVWATMWFPQRPNVGCFCIQATHTNQLDETYLARVLIAFLDF